MLSNYKRTVLYVGVTSDLERRIYEHEQGLNKGFTQKYKVKYLMYYEIFNRAIDAIEREKSLKGKGRKKKNALINAFNPKWEDLSPKLF